MSWRKWIKPAFIATYVFCLCIGLPFSIISLKNASVTSMEFACFVGGLFVLGAIPISLWTILEHQISYTKPHLQRHIIRILWMVPIYAVNAWFALRFPKTAIYFDTLRECYEAYAIYNFLVFLLNYLRRQYSDLPDHLAAKPQVKHIPPCCCLRSWAMGSPFIEHCRHGVLQYTIIRPVTTIIALICEVCGVYGETDFSPKYAYVYLTVVNNISQIWALYCLVLFYQCTKDELREMHPISKFICVKFVVFMSFWQSFAISILAAAGIIDKVQAWKLYDVSSIGIALQNFAICIEMFIAAIGHHIAFTAAPYQDANVPRLPCCHSWWSMLDVSDVKRDVVQHVRHVGCSVGFIGRDGSSNIDTMPRTVIVSGLARSRAGGRFGDAEFSPLIPSAEEADDEAEGEDGGALEEDPKTPIPPRSPPRRRQNEDNYRLAPDGPWKDDEDGNGSNDDDGSYDMLIRPDFISVPQNSP